MKQEATKKNKLWIVLVACLAALLVVAGVVTALFLLPGEQEPEKTPAGLTEGRPELYWNIDRVAFTADSETGLSNREPGEDGLFHVRFAYNGEQIELTVADRQLVNYMDTFDVMGLEKDADGMIIDVIDPKTIATEKAKDFFVKKMDSGSLILNSAKAMNGMELELELTELAGVYDVSPEAEVVGQTAVAGPLDKVLVYTNALDQVTHVYITSHPVDAGVYWRVDQKYNSTDKVTTREPDENGVYTIPFAHEGALVDMKCKDVNIVTSIDKGNSIYAEFAFVLDDEGYIIESVDVAEALKGLKGCTNYDVTELDGNSFTATRYLSGEDKGATYSATFDENCDIFLVEDGCDADFIGQRVDSLKMGDRITVYTDLEGNPVLIFILNRRVDVPMYYNLESKALKDDVTTREKDANGYYVFDMACKGKKVQVKTKDTELATRIDKLSPSLMGLHVEGSIIKEMYAPGCVSGWMAAFNGYFVQSVAGPVITIIQPKTGNTRNVMLAQNAEVYNIANNFGAEVGGVTALKPGDRIVTARNISEELTHVYVLQRYEESSKLYYNVGRKYDAEKEETTREPDENGYYVYDMLSGGKQYSLKTKNKKMADWIDGETTNLVSLKTSGSTITGAYQHVTALLYGQLPAGYRYINSINWTDRTFTTYSISNDVRKDVATVYTLAEDCVVYNVSTGFMEYRGEKTTLKKDDRIQGFTTTYGTNEINLILVISRKIDSPLYWNKSQKYDSTKKETTRVPDADGWYVYELFVDGETKQFKTKDKELASRVDSYSTAFALRVDGDVILNVYGDSVAKNVKTCVASSYDVMAIDGNKLTLVRNRPLTSDYGTVKEFEMYKGTKTYDISSYAENRGAKATVSLGDRVTVYSNMEGKLEYIYIRNKNTHEKGHVSYCEHCDKEVFWEPYSQTLFQTDVHYYIPADMVSFGSKEIGYAAPEEGQEQFDIVFDLNGKTVTANYRFATVYSSLTIMDTVGGGKIVGMNKSGGLGGMFIVTGNGVLNLRSGTLELAEEPSKISRDGGIAYFAKNTTFNMYGGVIENGTVAPKEGDETVARGGNVFLYGATFNMYGGVIRNGSNPTGRGGNMYMGGKAVFNMYGGEIQGGEAPNGGSIYSTGDNTINMRGGVIENGKVVSEEGATGRGGNIFFYDGTFNLHDGVIRNGSNPTGQGGNLFVGGIAVMNMYGGKIQGGEGSEGGSVYTAGASTEKKVTFNMEGGVIENGVAAPYGGNIFARSTDMILAGTVQGGKAVAGMYQGAETSGTGGNLYITTGAVTTVKGTLKDAEAYNGGNVRIAKAELILQGGTISGGKAERRGGNIYITSQSILTINSGKIQGGVAPDNGGNIYTNSANAIITMNGGSIENGTGLRGGNIFLDSSALFKVNGGKIVGGVASTMGGNICSVSRAANVEIAGGEIAGGTAQDGGNIYISGSNETTLANLTVGSANIAGDVVLGNYVNTTLTGASKITKGSVTGLKIAAGNMIDVSGMTEGASVVLSGDGVFTAENSQAALPYFTPAEEGETITANGSGALVYTKAGVDYNANLVFAEGTNVAYCPVCDAEVEWIEVNQTTNSTTTLRPADTGAASTHYYLSEDLSFTGTDAFLQAPKAPDGIQNIACFHLNGHNLTTESRAFTGNTGVLNVMGNGTVTGGYSGTGGYYSTFGATVNINTTGANGTVNLYGGTYTKAATTTNPTVAVNDNGGIINVFEGATINGGAAAYHGKLNITGAVVSGGVNVKIRATGKTPAAVLTDATVDTVTYSAGSLTLAGECKLDLVVEGGLKIKLGDLTSGALIKVAATGVFTENYDKIADYASLFQPLGQYDKISIKGSALSCDGDYNKALTFAAGSNTAYCAVCKAEVEWIEVNQTTNGEATLRPADASTHYYLSEDVSYTGTDAFIQAPGSNKSACLHLNGHNLTTQSARSIGGYSGVLNVMGDGIVTGGYTGTGSYGATVHISTTVAAGTVNLFGGTYTKVESTPNVTLVVHDNGGNINIYEDAIVNGGATVYHGNLNVTGATVNGTLTVKLRVAENGKSPAVTLTDATVESVSFSAGSLTLAGTSKLSLAVAEGQKITLGELAQDAAITVSAVDVFTETCEKAAEYATFFTAATEGDSVEAQDNTLRYVTGS